MHGHQPCRHGSNDVGCADLLPPALKLIPACPASSCVVKARISCHDSPVKLPSRGNVEGLLDDILELKPHVFCSVPRLWNRIYDRVMATIRESETSPTGNQLPLLQATVCRGMCLPLGWQLRAEQFRSTVRLLYTSNPAGTFSRISLDHGLQ